MNQLVLAILRAFQPIDYYSADISGLERKYAERLRTWSKR